MLLDTCVPEPEARHRAFAAVESIPSIRAKAVSAGWRARATPSTHAAKLMRFRRNFPTTAAKVCLARGAS